MRQDPLVVLALLTLGACAERDSEYVASELTHIEKKWDGILVEFGVPQALPLLGEGWSYGEVAPDGNSLRWAVSEEASFRFESPREGKHLAWFEVEPFRAEGSPTQFIGITLNGEELPPIELRAGRDRYPRELELRAGGNEVGLRFRYAGDPTRASADRRRLAVAFYRFDVSFDGLSPVAGRPGPFARVDDALFIPAGGSISFFHEGGTPARLRLRLGSDHSPRLAAARGSGVRVTIRSPAVSREHTVVAEAEVTTWEEALDSAAPVEVSLEAAHDPILVRSEILTHKPAVARPTNSPAFDDFNIVVIVLDGANALRTGLYGHERDTTPVLDRLGRESVVFDTAVSQAVYTIASIGSLFTGQYPERHQIVTFADRLRDDVPTVSAIFTDAGFRTAAFAGNAVVSRAFGLDRGFEEFLPVTELEDYTGHGDSVVKAFRSWLAEHRDERFFAYVHFREPHFPYNPPPPFDTRFGPATAYPGGMSDASVLDDLNRDPPSPEVKARVGALYEGNLAYVDDLVGKLLECLDERTVVVVTADHGEAIFEHGFLGHNTQLYEESIRVPLVIRVPRVPPRRVPGVVELLDLTPTLLEIGGLGDHPAREAMQGRSLLPLVLGTEEQAAPRPAFSRTLWDKPRYSVRNERYKLIWDSRTGHTELYDLAVDPAESRNIAGNGSLEERYLRHVLFTWFREQERLKAGEPPPDVSQMTERQRREVESLGYTQATRTK
ncbi:MAG TPA: sulfatase [Vicinamibacteria bacterium]|nr:sulfatase [Vicinamibacteria bacterium]